MARHLFSKVTSGEVEIVIGQEFALADVQAAHDALEGRRNYWLNNSDCLGAI